MRHREIGAGRHAGRKEIDQVSPRGPGGGITAAAGHDDPDSKSKKKEKELAS